MTGAVKGYRYVSLNAIAPPVLMPKVPTSPRRQTAVESDCCRPVLAAYDDSRFAAGRRTGDPLTLNMFVRKCPCHTPAIGIGKVPVSSITPARRCETTATD